MTALEQRCRDIAEAVELAERLQEAKRLAGPTIRLYDGNWRIQDQIRCEDEFDLTEIENDSAGGRLRLDGDLDVAQWLWDLKGRKDRGETIDCFLVVDYVGWRWSGRLDDCILTTDEMGNVIVESLWEHDYGQLKARTLWATPLTPAGFQPFKIYMCAGPTDWALATSLWVNLARAHGNPVGWSGDPVARTDANYQNWPIVLKPFSYGQALAGGVTTGIVLSRFKSWHDAANQMLLDAEVTTRVRRYLPGDELPWPGANLKYGTLVVSFEHTGGGLTNNVTGSLLGGIGQSISIFLSALVEGIGGGSLPIETGDAPLTGQSPIPAYQVPGKLGTDPRRPYVLYTERSPGLVKCEAHLRPAKYKRLTGGGHSAPMVNEIISATINAVGDAVAALWSPIPPLGGVADALLKPFYTDVILAFMTVYLNHRAAHTSKWGLYELFVEGMDKAFTISSTMVLRAAVNATATQFSAQMEIVDGAPWWVGSGGDGDMEIGTRILMQVPGDQSGRIYAERIRKLQLTGKRGQLPAWTPTIGALEPTEDPLVRTMRNIEKLISGLKTAGVM